MIDLTKHSLKIDVAESISKLYVYKLAPDETEDDHAFVHTEPKNHSLLVLEYVISIKQLLDLMEFCQKAKGHECYSQVKDEFMYHLEDLFSGPAFEFNCEVADAIYHHLKREFAKLPKRLSYTPSDFVCMKMVTRLKELRRADPGKAKANRVDISWMRELYIAAQEAEQEESKKG